MMPPKYGIEDVSNITFVNMKTGQRIEFDSTVTTVEVQREPVDYLVKLDRKVRNSDIEDLRKIGINVILPEITEQPNWFVVRMYHPQKKDKILRFVEDVAEVIEVRLELSEA